MNAQMKSPNYQKQNAHANGWFMRFLLCSLCPYEKKRNTDCPVFTSRQDLIFWPSNFGDTIVASFAIASCELLVTLRVANNFAF